MNSTPSSASAGLAEACATSLLETLPHVMDRMRSEVGCGAAGALSVPQFRCLCFLGRSPKTSLGGLACQIGVSTATTSALVERLVRQGLVERALAPNERRRLSLSLTQHGSEVLSQARAVVREHIASLMATCSERDLAALKRGLDLLRGLFETDAVNAPRAMVK
ncbi:MAG: MarR family winged helix-turn-helix transcriptional regulator [Acidiferrobacteraceae bacterium]